MRQAPAKSISDWAAATEPLVLEAVDSDSDVEEAPQSCRIVHETTALGSNHACEAAYFVDEGSESNESEEAPAYVVDEGSDTGRRLLELSSKKLHRKALAGV